MLTRIISALVAIPILLYVVFKGDNTLTIGVLIVSTLGIIEFFNAFNNIKIKPSKSVGVISCLLLFIINMFSYEPVNFLPLWFFSMGLLVLIKMVLDSKFTIMDTLVTITGLFYVSFLINHIALMTKNVNYDKFIWLIFIVAWATDTCAYFTGYLFGKNKLCPDISPKKTIEGAIGGIFGSVLVSVIYSYYFIPKYVIHFAIIGLIGSILGQIGDLVASMFKRYCGIKDYGKIMPGHGGILDRFDSILFTAPLVYYYVTFML
ncbi:phosphatidate cytidylyltransferase [Anaeromicrobium sediminis]|uniref:Phosphatidate cytidylyltransferase n=1 Tax=Anaeromicrobium sediminis TaxID=1478221 RepID=A0A267MNR0_9FIRM|nr:phosphatidate cytidylyltransferase [Anaeromicrobium sediminis]PAB61234.1 phosphatidate cytidylyltransferase [Anaeromicrobium sediminis]